MNKIQSIEELFALRDKVKSQVRIREQGEHIEELTTVTVYMGASGKEAGAKEIFNYFMDSIAEQDNTDIVVMQADNTNSNQSEPLVAVSIPGKDTVLFGNVTKDKVDEIITKYIGEGEMIDGIVSLTS